MDPQSVPQTWERIGDVLASPEAVAAAGAAALIIGAFMLFMMSLGPIMTIFAAYFTVKARANEKAGNRDVATKAWKRAFICLLYPTCASLFIGLLSFDLFLLVFGAGYGYWIYQAIQRYTNRVEVEPAAK
jgi:hypothetical protein